MMYRTGFAAAFLLAWLAPALAAQERPGVPSGETKPDAGSEPRHSPVVRLEVDPVSGKIGARTPNRWTGGGPGATVNDSFDFVSATCTDCTGSCPSFSRTIVVVLEANAAVSNYSVGGVFSGNYTLTSLGESGNDPIAVGEQFTITFTGDLLACSIFSLFFDVCSPASPASPTGACAPDEAQVNTYTTGNQTEPAVAMSSDGDFVVVWESGGSSGGDTSAYSIQGQRYASDGSAAGSQFQVNTYTTFAQVRPAVAADPAGDFVVVWGSVGSSGTDTSSTSIQGQRFAADGTPAGVEFQVNTYTTDQQGGPAVAVEADGDFVVVWGSDTQDGALYGVFGQRFASDGSVVGVEFQVNTYTTGSQGGPAVAMDSDGGFVVVWASPGSSGNDSLLNSIQGQRYAADGTTVGGEFQINTFTTGNQVFPAVAADPDGDFVVVWRGPGDASGDSIRGRRYASDGTPAGSDFQVNTYTTGGQDRPSVAMDSAGNFVVTWESPGSSGSDSLSDSIQGQLFAADGTAIGGEFQVNTYTTDNQRDPVVAADPAGDFVVVWESDGSSGSDTAGESVQRQLFFGPLQ